MFHKEYNRKYKDATEFAVWQRWEGIIPPLPGYVVVFGHTPTVEFRNETTLKIWAGEHFIAIDCGSGFPDGIDPWYCAQGRLACLRLDDMKEFYSEEAN